MDRLVSIVTNVCYDTRLAGCVSVWPGRRNVTEAWVGDTDCDTSDKTLHCILLLYVAYTVHCMLHILLPVMYVYTP